MRDKLDLTGVSMAHNNSLDRKAAEAERVRKLRVLNHRKEHEEKKRRNRKIAIAAVLIVSLALTYGGLYGNARSELAQERGAKQNYTPTSGPATVITDPSQVPTFDEINERIAENIEAWFDGEGLSK